jgi:hypothetical protein
MSRSPYDFNVESQSFQLVLSPYDLVNGRNYLIRMRTLDSDREDHIAKYNGSYYEPSFTVLYTRDARKDENDKYNKWRANYETLYIDRLPFFSNDGVRVFDLGVNGQDIKRNFSPDQLLVSNININTAHTRSRVPKSIFRRPSRTGGKRKSKKSKKGTKRSYKKR